MTRPELRVCLHPRSFLAMPILIVAVLLCVGVLPAWTQVTSMGTVTGTVTDKTGAVIPAATVTLTDTLTQEKRTASTNSAVCTPS